MSMKSKNNVLQYVVLVLTIAVTLPLWKTMQSSDPISFMLPNLLLFTQYREKARALWFKLVKVDTKIIREPSHVPVINAADYSFETLREAT
ncbi:hypothetical protein EON65_52325, partial [archaeon]